MRNAISGEFRKTFTRRLRGALFKADVLQQELADEMGVTVGTVNGWLSGRTLPKMDSIPDICRALHVSPAWLLGMTDDTTEVG